jgi:2-(1,2-epoxy-1,2-dihydrophenyl)acetyl-CoA isomerase
MKNIKLAINQDFAEILLDNQAQYNAMTLEMADEFFYAVTQVKKAQHKLVALVIRGKGDYFSSGGDLKMLRKKTTFTKKKNIKLMLDFYKKFLSFKTLSIPTIALLSGGAVGAAACLAVAADYRLFSEQAFLKFSFLNLALYPGMGVTYFLPALVGKKRAYQLLAFARNLDSNECLRLGIADGVFSRDMVEDELKRLISSLSRLNKKLVAKLLLIDKKAKRDLSHSLQLEAKEQANSYASLEFKVRVEKMLKL